MSAVSRVRRSAGILLADAIIFIAAKRGVGDDAIDLVVGTPFVPANAQRVFVLDLTGHVDAVQQHVGGAQQVWQLLFLDAVDQILNGALVFGAGLGGDLITKMIDGSRQKSTRATGRVHHGFAFVQARVDPVGHKGGDGARGVELARIARAAQVVEHLFVDIAQAGAGFEVVEVDGCFQFFDHGQHLRARLHVIVGIAKHLANDLVLCAAVGVNLVFQHRERVRY